MPNFNINVAQPFQGLQGVIGEELGRQQQAGWEEEAMGLLESGDMGALAKFSIAHPELGQRVREQAGHKNATTEAIRRDAARKIMMLPEGGDHTQIITAAAEKIRQAGGTPTEMETLLDLPYEDAVRIAEEQVASRWPTDWMAMDKLKKSRAGVDLSELPAEARAFRDLIKDFTPEQQKLAKEVKAGLKGRAVSNAILSAIEDGNITKLSDARAQIKEAEAFAGLTGSSRAKAIDRGFDSIVKIDRGIKNIDNAITVLKQGAGVGAVEKIWPSIRAASVELDNIRGRMALDVIGAVTFGALSKGELDLAMDIALPTGLDTEELIDYLNRRKVAQTKLRAYFNEQIQYFDQGGTVAGFLRKKETDQGGEQLSPATDTTGSPLSLLPAGSTDNGDGTFTLPTGEIVEPS